MHASKGRVVLSPSDVTAHLACTHLTTLSLSVAHGELVAPPLENEQAELIFRKGREHEHAHLEQLEREGKTIARVSLKPDFDWQRAARETEAAMRAGVDVVFQAALVGDRWRGQADFLLRVETPSELGSWSYEALDTKLARHAKPAYILQLCFYSERLAAIQRVSPARIHVLLGNLTQESFRPEDFAAYYRRVCRRLEQFVAEPPPTEAFPCEQCGICEFKPLCDAYWDDVDHLCRVAWIQRRQIDKLGAAGITTLAALGEAPAEPAPRGIPAETFEKLREQARLQLESRLSGVDAYVILPPSPDTGFTLLPDPSPGDLFFDFEGNPFWDSEGSLEYLWGILDAEGGFDPMFASTRDEERAAFERFVDFVHARLADDPAMHVYHYASYEITALRRLMGQYGTREEELDDLLRRGVFVDLFKVVRGGLRVSRPGYGLKELETFLPLRRNAQIKEGGASIVAFEEWMVSRDQAILDAISDYNREDCIATLMLRDWLLERRQEALDAFGRFPVREPEKPKPIPERKAERAALREALLATGDETCTLAAQLLDYHDRERKPVWWAFFDRMEMTPEQLVEDADSIGRVIPTGSSEPVKRSIAHVLTYPPQEHKLGQGQEVLDRATGKSAGEILELDPERRRLKLKRGPSLDEVALPEALIPGRPYDTNDQEDALERIGRGLIARTNSYPAIETILRRTPFERPVQTTDLNEMTALLLSLEGRHLLIQGPPGSGKTWLSGRLIGRLVEAGKTVAVASTSHKAIHKLLAEVEAAAAEIGLDFRGLKKASSGNPESRYEGHSIENVFSNEDCQNADLLGGTAWLFSDRDLDARLDYLFVDEAGQVSLADALAMSTCARNVVLVGDPQQLGQVRQGSHPDGTDQSVLEFLLAGEPTVPPERGLFLDRTFRLHPDLCAYISEEFYEGRLRPDPVTSSRTTPLGTGLRWIPVEHDGCRQQSEEEADAVQAEIERLTAAGVAPSEIKVVAPYNAQVELLRSKLPAGVETGTVDKFQGQEAKVVFYSMTSSSGEDVPRGLDFLLSRNRFNVAISRAQCLAYLVCSPRLLEVDCTTIAHMRLANALCRFVELAPPPPQEADRELNGSLSNRPRPS
jgi:predicted RecB family nuclease